VTKMMISSSFLLLKTSILGLLIRKVYFVSLILWNFWQICKSKFVIVYCYHCRFTEQEEYVRYLEEAHAQQSLQWRV